MKRESPDVEQGQREADERERRKAALHVLIEARERLLAQMAEDVLSNSDVLLDGSTQDGFSNFELEEIEDRYSARLNALNSLLENLEYRQAKVKYHVETLTTTPRHLKKDLRRGKGSSCALTMPQEIPGHTGKCCKYEENK